jgi:putative transposase
VGGVERGATRTLADTAGETRPSKRWRSGLPIREDHRRWRRAAWLHGGKKVRARKRHLLVDTEGLVLTAKVHSAKVPDQDGIRLLLESVRYRIPRLRHVWLDQGYEGRGKRWAEDFLGLDVEIVRRPPKPVPEEVAKRWAEEWAKEGQKVDWQRLMPPRGFVALPRRWVVERTFAWLGQNRRMSKDYERLCSKSEAFIYAAMTRLMARRLVRA